MLAAMASTAAERQQIGNITASQGVVAENNRFTAGETVTVTFTMHAPASVTVTVFSAQPLGTGQRWYAHPATQCAAFTVQMAKAGPQQFTFKLADLKAPETPLPLAKEKKNEALNTGRLPELPGEYVIEVNDGKNVAHVVAHFYAAGEVLYAHRAIPGVIIGAIRDSKGNLLLADRGAWRGRRYSPAWKLEVTYPTASLGQSSDPVECFDVAVDSHDEVYLATSGGLYKYQANGDPAPYAADEDYIKYPYPGVTRNLLGIKLDPSVQGTKRYVFGPGGSGAGSKDYDAQQMVKQPGFSFQWGGVAIDAQDNIYLARLNPDPEIQVFNHAGNFLRKLPVPQGMQPLSMRFGTNGALWLGCSSSLLRVHPLTGAEEKRINNIAVRTVHIGPDGTIYAFGDSRVWRFTPDGDVLPFTDQGATVRENGRYLQLSPAENNVLPGTAGYAVNISGVVGHADGSFELFAAWKDNPSNGMRAVLRFNAAGTFQPTTPAVSMLPHQTGNIFLNEESAFIGLQLINFSNTPASISSEITVRDLDEQLIATRRETREIPAMSIIAAPAPLDPPLPAAGIAADTRERFGYYIIDAVIKSGMTTLSSAQLFGGRLADRGSVFPPYSPFGSVRMDGNPELLRRAGGGLNRGHSAVYWNDVEARSGEWTFFPADSLTFLRQRALPTMSILGYGEPWDNGGFARCRITSYDTFWQYCATVIRRHKGTPMMWQFWNEPNYFWHVPGPYRYEHYVMALKGAYALAKSIDPDTLFICDGFAGEAKMMAQFGEWGAGDYTDGLPIHYPGATTISFDNMPVEGAVESKAAMISELAAIRDRYYPGREMLNTEEGLWGLANRTPINGAELLPRIYVTQIAAGLDRLTWFECFSRDDPTYLLRGAQDGPWPAYFAYATASRMLEDAQYVGALSDDLAQLHLFALHGNPLVVAWSMQDTREYVLPVKIRSMTITDWQGNSSKFVKKKSAANTAYTLRLTPTVQYLTDLPEELLQQYLASFIETKQQDADLAGALRQLNNGTEQLPLNLLHAAARSEQIARLQSGRTFDYAKAVKAANTHFLEMEHALKMRETGGAYLRDTRVALEIARRAAYFMNSAFNQGGKAYAGRLAGLVDNLTAQAMMYLQSEPAWYPGVMLRVALDTTAIRARTPAAEPLDEKFAPQVTKKPGETVELEITLYNWLEQPITGSFSPVLPTGWQAQQTAFPYNVAPNTFQRVSTLVTIPADTPAGMYDLGAYTSYQGVLQRELHTHRVEVKP